jgi:TIR domain-containing protein
MNQPPGTQKILGGHVFLSYGHGEDSGTYVKSLADHLTNAGVPVWFDNDIEVGENWEDVIMSRIDASVAFIVVMTPEAQESDNVSDEINYAKDTKKVIVPLLLHGNRLFNLSNIQYEKVPKDDKDDDWPLSKKLTSRLVIMSALGPDPSRANERQEVARRLDRVPTMRNEAQRAELAMRLRARLGEIIVENPSVSRIAFTFAQRPNGWSELRAIANEHPEIFPPGDAAVVGLMRFLDALWTLSDQGVGD